MSEQAKEIFMMVLAFAVVACVLALAYLLMTQSVPAENRDMVNIALGAFISAFTTIIGYFFGSSKGSADKTNMLIEHQQLSSKGD